MCQQNAFALRNIEMHEINFRLYDSRVRDQGIVHLGLNVSAPPITVGVWSVLITLSVCQQFEYYYYYYYYYTCVMGVFSI